MTATMATMPHPDSTIQAASAGCIHRSNPARRENRYSSRVAGSTTPNRIPHSIEVFWDTTSRSRTANTA